MEQKYEDYINQLEDELDIAKERYADEGYSGAKERRSNNNSGLSSPRRTGGSPSPTRRPRPNRDMSDIDSETPSPVAS